MSNSIIKSLKDCRVCLSHDYKGGINLDENEDILQLLQFCLGLPIQLECSSKMICAECAETIEKYAKFKKKCINSEEIWKSYRNHQNNISKISIPIEIKLEKEEKYEELSSYNHGDLIFETNDFEYKDKIDDINNCEVKKVNVSKYSNIKESSYKNSNGTGRYKCEKCKKEYRKFRWLVIHKQNCSMNKNELSKDIFTSSKLICGLCSVELNNVGDLSKHLKEHWSNNDMECQLCSFVGRDFADMITHSFQHRSKRSYFCPACHKKKASAFSLQFHFRSVHLQKAGGLCSVCNKTFARYKSWTKHERLHNDSNLFICDHCGRKYVFRHEIKLHLINHTEERRFVCETCGNSFRRMSTLKDHIENVHKFNPPVKCNHCNKFYKNQIKLALHLKFIAKDKPYICEVCSKKFVSEKVLKKHMFWHTEERPFSCDVCGLKYKAKGQLKIHLRKHSGFMPHKCCDCGKGFPNGYQLKRHSSVHTGIKVHKCDLCERSFHEKKALLEHVDQHKNMVTLQAVKVEN